MAQTQKPKRKPTELSDFEGLTQIGHGAFGTVYRAVHKNAKKAFALKKISKKEIKSQNMITQLNNEIKISRQLDHPNIIKLYDTFDNGEDIYLVLQLAQNGQLFSKIVREGKLDEKTAKQMIKEVLEAVSYLHSRDPPIIHRDIKPENILLDKNNKVKLADFGWSNFLNKPRKTYCGTFDYLAPEMIDKSGHDQKLDIWCLGVLAYELLTGRTPFVVQGPKNETKKIIEQNILQVNVNFPNDFPILAKSFILGMIKRKPEERMTLKEIMNHEWLTTPSHVEKQFLTQVAMPKKGHKEIPLIDAQESTIIDSLNKRIRELEEEVNRLKVNQKVMNDQSKGLAGNAQYNSLMKEVRKLRGVQQKNVQLQQDNQKYWADLNKKDKDIIELKAQIKTLEENQDSIDKLKQDKRQLQDKLKKTEKQVQNLQVKNSQLSAELSGLNLTIGAKLAKGDKIELAEANSKEYLQLIQKEMQVLEASFSDSKKVLMKVLSKQKMTKEKEEELVRLRTQKARLKDDLKTELRQEFEQQKDQIILEARNELALQKEKWLKERNELKRFYEEQNVESSNKGPNVKQEMELQIKTLRELVGLYQSTINELQVRLKEAEEELKRKR